MDITTLSFVTMIAATGYGEVVDGQPSWAQREMQVYTNFARVAPADWADEYPCDFSGFTSEEQTSQAPLYYHDGLASIAQMHSQDMYSHDFMAHESSDGTDFGTRVWPWYGGTMIGENVAYGYADNWDVVFEGWMCSAGHRSNIMAADFEDIGTGVISRSYTQNFGAGAGTPHIQVAMGVHVPEVPTREVEFVATYDDSEAPLVLAVETDDECLEMALSAGDPARGAYAAVGQAADGCVPYRFTWESGDGILGVLPESGAYLYGEGCDEWTDAEPDGCSPSESDDDPSDQPDGDNGADDANGDGLDDQQSEAGSRNSDCPGGVASCLSEDDKTEPAAGCATVSMSPASGWLSLILAPLIVVGRRRI